MTQAIAPEAAPDARVKGGRRRRQPKPSCETCYFGCRALCALDLSEPCSTFRPDSPHGLVPPTQPALLVRSDPAGSAVVELATAS